MQSAREHQRQYDDFVSNPDEVMQAGLAYVPWRNLVVDYARLEASHQHLLAIVLRLGELAATDEQPDSSWESVCEQAMRVLEAHGHHLSPHHHSSVRTETMPESLSDLIRRTPDAEKRQICAWCAARGTWDFPVTEIYKGEELTLYCCTVEHQQRMQAALE